MQIQQTQNGHKGKFYVEQDGKELAEMTYTMAGDTKMIIDHTEVDDVLKGKSVGKQLVHAGVEYARTHGLKILPLCPFAKAVFDKTPDYADVLF